MRIFLCVCAGLTTISLIVVAIQSVITLAQVRHTARAVELLALNANEKVDSINGFIDTMRSISDGVRSGWFKGLQFAAGLFSSHGRKSEEN